MPETRVKIVCECGQTLGTWHDGYIEVRHGGRVIAFKSPLWCQCERCKRISRMLPSVESGESVIVRERV